MFCSSVDQIDERKKMRMDPVQDIHKYLSEKSKHKEKDKKKRKKKKHSELVGFRLTNLDISNN